MMATKDKPRLDYMTGDEYDTVRPHIKQFEQRVWFGSLFEHVNGTTCRGQKGQAGKYEVLVWTCAGRTMITLRNGTGDWLSLMVAEDQATPSMGLHERSIETGKIPEWLEYVADNWEGVTDADDVTLDVLT